MAAFLSSLALVVISVGFTPLWMVLASSGVIAVASVLAFHAYEFVGQQLHRRRS